MDLPDHENDEQITKSRKVLAISKGVAIVAVVSSLLLTSFATVVILIGQDHAADRMLDCVLSTGKCYQQKIRENQQTSDAEIVIIVNYCINKTPDSLDATRECVTNELRKR